jgi:hypothetical protein
VEKQDKVMTITLNAEPDRVSEAVMWATQPGDGMGGFTSIARLCAEFATAAVKPPLLGRGVSEP